MPDGDRIYNRPQGQGFNQSFEMMLDGRPLSKIAFRLQAALAARIRKYGNEPRQLIEQVSEIIRSSEILLSNGEELNVDEANLQISCTAEQFLGHRRGMPLALDATKAILLDLVAARNDATTIQFSVAVEYLWRIYDADFSESLSLDIQRTHPHIQQADVNDQLAELRIELEPVVKDFASRFLRVSDVKKFKRSSRDDINFDNYSDEMINEGSL